MWISLLIHWRRGLTT